MTSVLSETPIHPAEQLETKARVLTQEERSAEAEKAKKAIEAAKIPWRVRVREFFSHKTIERFQDDGRDVASLFAFFGLVLLFLLESMVKTLGKLPGASRAAQGRAGGLGAKLFERLASKLEASPGHIRRSVLINLAFRNMRVKKTRAFVTVGGMAMGIAAIVFLVSLGYGVQRLVVSRVARLDELKMADITTSSASNLRIDVNALTTMKNMPSVTKVLPVVSLVGKINFAGGQGEAVVHGVSKAYLEAAGIKPVAGEYFESEDGVALGLMAGQGQVAGVSDDKSLQPGVMGQSIREGRIRIREGGAVRLREQASSGSKKLGMVRDSEQGYYGRFIWGASYSGENGNLGPNSNGEKVGIWIYGSYPLWEEKDGNYVPVIGADSAQVWAKGYVAMTETVVEVEAPNLQGSVLGEATSSELSEDEILGLTDDIASISATVVETDASGAEWVSLESLEGSAAAQRAEILEIALPEGAKKQALVNQPFLDLIGITRERAVGGTFETSFVIVNTLKPDLDRPAQSARSTYTIAGVIEEGASPMAYVPIEDLTGLGISNFTQAKIVVEATDKLAQVRQQIDNLGYKTSSVADTVAQIDQLFGTIRMVLASFGLVALSVASLGMFNTLTVSLMERTREVGVMKAMGMRSGEVKELFLAEAMIMGLLGGVFGIMTGWLFGKLIGLLLSVVAIARGVGWIDITYVPWQFVVFILVLSFVVGVLTGIYPARRARKISALNALRYE